MLIGCHLQAIQQDSVANSLKGAEGFVGTADQERFDECEEAVLCILSQVRKVAKQWVVSDLVHL
jgi:centromere/kinetochore protein ZW10